jgi:hypothetical protein
MGKEGEQRGITPEIAQQILEALGLNGDRKLPSAAMNRRLRAIRKARIGNEVCRIV